ncbi:MAG: CBS domain-containing protein [Vampirovibrionales bacterium]
MSGNPKAIAPDAMAAEALQLMEAHKITVLHVVDSAQQTVGVLHLHDILDNGIQ